MSGSIGNSQFYMNGLGHCQLEASKPEKFIDVAEKKEKLVEQSSKLARQLPCQLRRKLHLWFRNLENKGLLYCDNEMNNEAVLCVDAQQRKIIKMKFARKKSITSYCNPLLLEHLAQNCTPQVSCTTLTWCTGSSELAHG